MAVDIVEVDKKLLLLGFDLEGGVIVALGYKVGDIQGFLRASH